MATTVRERARERVRRIVWQADRGTTEALRERFTKLDPEAITCFRAHLLANWSNQTYWDSDIGRHEIDQHAVGRLIFDRHEYVPWLNSLRRLAGARVLEIGCGTGSSIMALIEQGANVTGIDVVPEAVEMTRTRLRCFGVAEPPLHAMNATEIDAHFDHGSFDFVIFFASLEHMTHSERSSSLRAAWRLLAHDGILCIIEAPNRLWLFDNHTGDLPFFHWLPDDIALEYWTRSPRYQSSAFDITSADATLELYRRGRGVSFHDVELALAPIGDLEVMVDRQTFQMSQNPLRWFYYHQSDRRRYANMLRRQRPDLPMGLFMPYLDIAIRR
jgi:S-adenosylmethionine-dependent methyltransferase